MNELTLNITDKIQLEEISRWFVQVTKSLVKSEYSPSYKRDNVRYGNYVLYGAWPIEYDLNNMTVTLSYDRIEIALVKYAQYEIDLTEDELTEIIADDYNIITFSVWVDCYMKYDSKYPNLNSRFNLIKTISLKIYQSEILEQLFRSKENE